MGAGERLEPKWYGPNNTMGRRGILLDGGPPGGGPGRDCHPLVGVGAPAHAAQPSRQGARWGRDPGCRSDLGACSAEIAQPGGIGSFQYLCTMQDLVKLSSCRRVPVHRAFRPGRGPHLAFLPARPSGLRAPEPAAPTPHLPAGTRLRAASGSASQAPLLPNPGSEPAGLAVFVSGGGSNFRAIHAACAAGAVRGRVAVVVTNAPSCGGAQFARAHGIPVLVYPGSKSAVGLSADQLVEALTKVPGVCVDSAHVFVFARGGCKAPRPGREKGEGGARGGRGQGDGREDPRGEGRPTRICRTDTAFLRRAMSAPERRSCPAPLHSAQDYGVSYVVLAGYLKLIPAQLVAAFPRAMLNIHPGLLPAFGGPGLYGRRVHAAVLAAGARVSGPTVHFVDEEYDTGKAVGRPFLVWVGGRKRGGDLPCEVGPATRFMHGWGWILPGGGWVGHASRGQTSLARHAPPPPPQGPSSRRRPCRRPRWTPPSPWQRACWWR